MYRIHTYIYFNEHQTANLKIIYFYIQYKIVQISVVFIKSNFNYVIKYYVSLTLNLESIRLNL